MKEKSLKDISWQITEAEYREDPALSYSTLATFERGGFNCLSTLKDKKESPALTFGSAVDALITGGQQEFEDRFIVAEFPALSDKALKIIKDLFVENHIVSRDFDSIAENKVLNMIEKYEYWNNCKSETKLKKLSDEGVADYYNLLQLAEDKTIINSETYADILASVNALRESEATKEYFSMDNPFDDSTERLYQLKFKATLNGIEYRCMSDLLKVDYANKIIYPVDLKTSSHTEWDFFKSFIQWDYQIQARLYWRIIRNNLDRDPYFKDFTLAEYRFIVVNKTTLTPLVWIFPYTTQVGTITIGNINPIKLRDPEEIGKELSQYLQKNPSVPIGINLIGDNNLVTWLEKEYE
jgi:hypothetical protein